MDSICIATSDGRAYYSILSRLKATGLAFKSYTPSDVNHQECALILTTMKELKTIHGKTVVIEELDENPAIMKAQLVARLKTGKSELLVGIDPGSRIGVAIFYENVKLMSSTFGSLGQLLSLLQQIARSVSCSKIIVKIGGGSPRLSSSVASVVKNGIPGAVIEIVDERGTSDRSRWKDLTGDELAAVRIAYRKGVCV